jgi:hypothetical protein
VQKIQSASKIKEISILEEAIEERKKKRKYKKEKMKSRRASNGNQQ